MKHLKLSSLFLIAVFAFACKKEQPLQQNPQAQNQYSGPMLTGNWTLVNNNVGQPTSMITKDSVILIYSTQTYITKNNFNSCTTLLGSGFLFVNNAMILMGGTNFNILKSIDDGNTWSSIPMAHYDVWSEIVVGNTYFIGTTTGIYSSTDEINWTAINNGLPSPAQTVTSMVSNGSTIFAAMPSGVYTSTNMGVNWTLANNGLSLVNDHVLNLAVCNGNVFATTYTSGVYISTNNGANWNTSNNGITNFNQAGYPWVGTIAAFGNYMFITTGTYNTQRIFISTDYGNNWALLSGFPKNSVESAVVVKNNVVYVGGGIVTNNNIDFYGVMGQVWKCALDSLH